MSPGFDTSPKHVDARLVVKEQTGGTGDGSRGDEVLAEDVAIWAIVGGLCEDEYRSSAFG
jgi:hypothetical protein